PTPDRDVEVTIDAIHHGGGSLSSSCREYCQAIASVRRYNTRHIQPRPSTGDAPMSALAPLDIAIVIGYVLAMALMGVWFTRRQRTLRTYFVGDRNVAWWLILISIVTTETSAVTF